MYCLGLDVQYDSEVENENNRGYDFLKVLADLDKRTVLYNK